MTTLFSQLASAFSLGSATSPLDGAAAYSAFENVFQGGAPWINSSMWDETAPKAYLNYLLFDENFVLVDAGFDQVSTDCEQESDLNPIAPHDYLSLHVKVEQKGYLYVYLSNEEPTLTNVYFDDMKIVQYSPVEQVNDYYPFGLTFNSFERENSIEQRWKFQGQEHIDDLELNWDSFEWRNYESDIGRFFNIDPLTESFYHNSPYAFAENMVIDHVELEGLEGIQIHEFTKNDQGEEQLSKVVYQLDVVVVTSSKGDKKGNNSSSLTDRDVSEIRSYLGSIFGGEHTDPESGVPVSFEFNLNQLDKSATTTKKNGKQKVVAGEFSTTSVLSELNSRAQDVDDGTRSFPAFVFGGEVPGTDGGATSTTIKFDPESREGARNAFGHELLHFMLDRYEGDAHALGGLLGRPIRSGIEVNRAILQKLRQNVPRSSQNDRRK